MTKRECRKVIKTLRDNCTTSYVTEEVFFFSLFLSLSLCLRVCWIKWRNIDVITVYKPNGVTSTPHTNRHFKTQSTESTESTDITYQHNVINTHTNTNRLTYQHERESSTHNVHQHIIMQHINTYSKLTHQHTSTSRHVSRWGKAFPTIKEQGVFARLPCRTCQGQTSGLPLRPGLISRFNGGSQAVQSRWSPAQREPVTFGPVFPMIMFRTIPLDHFRYIPRSQVNAE